MKKIKEFSHEERLAIIETYKQIGPSKTAKKFDTSTRVVGYMLYSYAPKCGISVRKEEHGYSLEGENIVLKEKIALLTEQVNKLRSAVQTLA